MISDLVAGHQCAARDTTKTARLRMRGSGPALATLGVQASTGMGDQQKCLSINLTELVAQVSKSTGSRDEFGTHAEVELKTDEWVQACGVWVPTEVTAFGQTQAKRQKDRQMERTTKQNQ